MSIVTVQLGQCGNQIGTDLFNLLMNDATEVPKYSSTETNLNKEYHQEVLGRFFTSKGGRDREEFVAKSVLVDTELKVINQCIAQSEKSGMLLLKSTFFRNKVEVLTTSTVIGQL